MNNLPKFDNKIRLTKDLNERINMIVKYQNDQLKKKLEKELINK